MTNKALVITLGVIFSIAMLTITAIFVAVPGEKAVFIGAVTTALVLMTTALLSLKQSTDNGVKIDNATQIVKAAEAKVDENTILTVATAEQVEKTHKRVDGQMDAFQQTLREMVVQQQRFAELEARLATALAMAEGITQGRLQMAHDQTVQAQTVIEQTVIEQTMATPTLEETEPTNE